MLDFEIYFVKRIAQRAQSNALCSLLADESFNRIREAGCGCERVHLETLAAVPALPAGDRAVGVALPRLPRETCPRTL